ncbi:MAG: Peptidoglycan glycosyltransferase [Succiniclasticum sp.]|jgi:stage V sporulation protein D (sporulation-specific penicillin-binding protein)
MSKKPYRLGDARKRYHLFFLATLAVFVLLAGRLFYMQIIHGAEMARRSAAQTTDSIRRNTPRGRIVDRNGEELAVSIMVHSLYVNQKELNDNPDPSNPAPARNTARVAADKLAPVLHMDAAELYKDFTMKGQFLWVKRMLEPQEYEAVLKVIKDEKLPGLHFLTESKRYYTKKSMAAQVLGFVGTDDSGLSGLELALDSVLKGAETRHTKRIDALGRILASSDTDLDNSKETPMVATVYLTLDSKMQFVIEDALDDAMKRTKAQGAAILIMDPHTGAILAMGSRPTFDPNKFGSYPPQTWLNRAISMIYEPGSVFKPIVGCMGLSEGIITPTTPIYDGGRIRIADRVIQNWDGTGMGTVPFEDVIKYSINTGMVQVGMKLGAKREIEWAKKFGFGKATGIELPGEEDGILYDPKNMYDPDIATFAIGQGVAVTPLQELRAICAIANGGELLKPYIIDRIVAPNGEVIRKGSKQVVRNVITPEVAAQMRTMMEKVVSEGGGKTARIKGYRIAGKTGTAQKISPYGGYAPGEYIASFVGFVPADKPQHAMLVVLDNPRGAFYGSQVSAPIFRDTLQQILVAKGIQPSDSTALPSFEGKDTGDRSVPSLTPSGSNWILPSFQGLDSRTIAKILQTGRLVLEPYGSGTAYQQAPAPGSEVAPGSKVEVWFH